MDLIAPTFRKLVNPALDGHISELMLTGGRGTTKSSFGTLLPAYGMMEDYYVKGQITHAVALRKVGAGVENTIYNQFKWSVDKLGVSKYWRFKKSPLMATFMPSGQNVIFSGCDDPIKLKSIKFDKGHIKYRIFEEFNQFSGMEEIRNLNQSFVRGGDSLGIYMFNPYPFKNHWANVEMMKEVPRRINHHSTYLDVPKHWLGEEFIRLAELLKEESYRSYRNEYLGEVTGEGGEIFKNVQDITLSDEEIFQFEKIRQGLDFGFTIDPTAFVKVCYIKSKKDIYIYQSMFEYEMSTSSLCEELHKVCNPYETIKADSQEKRTINTMSHEYGVNVIPCKKGPDSVRHGVKWLQDLKNIYIDRKRCYDVYREFSNYQYAKNSKGIFTNKYPDIDNHTIDATRYSLDDIILEKGWRAKARR